MTIKKAIEILQESKFDTDGDALDFACHLADLVELTKTVQDQCQYAYREECLRTEAFENELKKTDPYSDEWQDIVADWKYSSTRSCAIYWFRHALHLRQNNLYA